MKQDLFKFHVLHTESLYSRGGEKYLYELLVRLAKVHDVHLHIHTISTKWRTKYAKAGVSVHILWRPPRLFWLLLPVTLIANYIKLKRDIDADAVVFATNFPMNLLAVLVSKRTICHCFEPLAIFYDPLRIASLSSFSQLCVRFAKLVYSWLDRAAYNKAAILTALAPSVEPYILETYGRKPDVFLPNGVDTEFFTPTPKHKRGRAPYVLGHSTDYTIFKGTENFLKILTFLRQKNISFVARISESISDIKIKKQYFAFVRASRLTDVVHFVGTVDESRLPAYYRSLDLFVYTGSTESAGGSTASLSVLEAQASGTPVIRSGGDDREIVSGETGFYIQPSDHKKAASIIGRYLRLTDGEKQRMRRSARKYVESQFSWSATGKILIQTAHKLFA